MKKLAIVIEGVQQSLLCAQDFTSGSVLSTFECMRYNGHKNALSSLVLVLCV